MVKRYFRLRPDHIDTRKKLRFMHPPKWPGAVELARAGTPIGVWITPVVGVYEGDALRHNKQGEVVNPTDAQRGVGLPLDAAVVFDTDGVMYELKALPVGRLVRWCLDRHLYIHHSLGQLVDAIERGDQVGWLHEAIIEHERGITAVVGVRPFKGPDENRELLPPGCYSDLDDLVE